VTKVVPCHLPPGRPARPRLGLPLQAPAWLAGAVGATQRCTASQARRVGAGMAAATVRCATCHRHAGRDVACCSRHPPSTARHAARARETLDGCEAPRRVVRRCVRRQAKLPVPMRAVRAWLVQQTHRAPPSTQCCASAPPHRAPPSMPRTACDGHRSAPGNSRRERVRLGRTPSRPQPKRGCEGRGCGRRHACARDVSVSVCMRMLASGLRAGRVCARHA
jgi:hypothetical protein